MKHVIMVLIYYPGAHFESDENQRGTHGKVNFFWFTAGQSQKIYKKNFIHEVIH